MEFRSLAVLLALTGTLAVGGASAMMFRSVEGHFIESVGGDEAPIGGLGGRAGGGGVGGGGGGGGEAEGTEESAIERLLNDHGPGSPEAPPGPAPGADAETLAPQGPPQGPVIDVRWLWTALPGAPVISEIKVPPPSSLSRWLPRPTVSSPQIDGPELPTVPRTDGLLPSEPPAMPAPPSAPSLPDVNGILPGAVDAAPHAMTGGAGFYWALYEGIEAGAAPGGRGPGSDAPVTESGPSPPGSGTARSPGRDRQEGGTHETLVAAAAAAAVGVMLLSPIITLYTRLVKKRLLANEVRRRLYEHVRSNPGAGSAEAARAVGVHITTAKRHLVVLHKFDFVTGINTRTGPRYFENHGRFPVEAARDILLLRRSENGEFLRALVRTPGMGSGEIARSAGVAKSTASRRLGILLAAGLIEKSEGGFVVTARALDALLIRVCDISVRVPAVRARARSWG